MHVPHGDRMATIVFLRVPSALGIQLAKNGCYTGTSIANFHLALPFYNAICIVTSDYAISLGNYFHLIFSLFFWHYAAFFSLSVFLKLMLAN